MTAPWAQWCQRRARLQRRDGHVVVRADGHLEVDQAAAVQLVHHARLAREAAQPRAARLRGRAAHTQLRRRQRPELRLACTAWRGCQGPGSMFQPTSALFRGMGRIAEFGASAGCLLRMFPGQLRKTQNDSCATNACSDEGQAATAKRCMHAYSCARTEPAKAALSSNPAEHSQTLLSTHMRASPQIPSSISQGVH